MTEHRELAPRRAIKLSALAAATGLALLLNTVTASPDTVREFPRPGAPDARTRGLMRMLPISLGIVLLLAGVAMLFVPASNAP